MKSVCTVEWFTPAAYCDASSSSAAPSIPSGIDVGVILNALRALRG